MMRASEFVSRLTDIAKNYKTLYVMGCFGAPMTHANKSRYQRNHVYNTDPTRSAMIRNASEDTFGFDCVNLIKGVLWGWVGKKEHAYGGAGYNINGVPDIGADTMMGRCRDATTDWSHIDPGEAVWMSGHIGVYIGNGLAVECTPRWKNCVQITAVGNLGKKSGYNTRTWTKHGHLPYIDYAEIETETPIKSPVKEVKATGVATKLDKSLAGSYTVTASALNVRNAAGTNAKILVTIPKGTVVKNYGYYTPVGNVKWLYVQFSHEGVTYTGFCSAEWLKR